MNFKTVGVIKITLLSCRIRFCTTGTSFGEIHASHITHYFTMGKTIIKSRNLTMRIMQ